MAVVEWPTDAVMKQAFEDYALAVGKVSYTWNKLHEMLGQLFAVVTGTERALGLAIWYSVGTDSGQRKMLRSAVHATEWPTRPAASEDLAWFIDQVDSIAEYRNNAVHAPVSLYMAGSATRIGPAFWTNNPRAQKLKGRRLLSEFAWCEACADLLSVYCANLEGALAFPDEKWPSRPVLPKRAAGSETRA